jgi:putative transposase
MIRNHPTHRTNLERHNKPVLLFVTVCALDRTVNTFATEEMHGILKEAWASAQSHHVGAYVLMPDHIHLFCAPAAFDSENVAKWVRFWKVLVTKKLGVSRIERTGGSRACATYGAEACAAPGKILPLVGTPKSIFQRDCWDTQLRAGDSYHEKWEYVRNNPVRKGLAFSADVWPFWGVMNELVW